MEWRRQTALRKAYLFRNKKVIGTYESTKGVYESGNKIPYKSEAELDVFKRIDENPLIVRWTHSPFPIPYFKLGIDRESYTIPDILIEYKDMKRKLVDVRPEGFAESSFTQFQAIVNYCNNNNMTYEVWGSDFRGMDTVKPPSGV